MASVFNIPAPAVAAPAAEAGPYVFAAGDITNPYAMTWNAYSMKLKRYLDDTYPVRQSVPARAAEAPAAPEAAGGRGHTIAAIKDALKSTNSPLKTSNPAWSNNRINSLVDDAAKAVPALPAGDVFILDNFVNSIIPELNNLARQNSKKGNAQALVAPLPINRVNIGM